MVGGAFWTTEQIDVVKRYNMSHLLKSSPFYGGNSDIRKAEIDFSPSLLEKSHLDKIEKIYSAVNQDTYALKTFMGDMHICGKNFVTYNYQELMYNSILNNRFLSILASRQSGLSTIISIFVLHTAIVKRDCDIIIICNMRESGKSLIDKIKHLYLQLPFYAKPGVHAWNDTSIKFDKNCNIRCEQSKHILSLDSRKTTILIVDQPMWMTDKKARIVKECILETKIVNPASNRVIMLQSGLGGYNLLTDYFTNNDSFHSVRYSYDLISGELGPEFEKRVNDMKRIIGEDVYNREWMLKWVSKN